MKIIVSHDVDHITAWEHWRDLVVPKALVRSSIELISGKIGLVEYFLRFREVALNKYQYLDELMRFDRENDVASTLSF